MLIGYGIPGETHDFFAYNADGLVWDTTAEEGAGGFVEFVSGDYANYRIAAAETGASGRFTAENVHGDVESYELRLRAGTLAGSVVLWTGEAAPLRPADPGRRLNVSIIGNAGVGFAAPQIAGLAALGTQIDQNGVESIVPDNDGIEAIQEEVAKIPREGQTYTHRNVDTDEEADVTIEAAD